VHGAAFAGTGEARLVRAIRDGPGFDPALSLVAVLEDRVVGHVLFSPVEIEGEVAAAAGALPARTAAVSRPIDALALAPVAVTPEWQRRGVGSALIRTGLEASRRAGHGIVIVLGHAAYYPRFGFVPASRHGITAPFPVPDEAFMVLCLTRGALDGVMGRVKYPPCFLAA
jgi:putative acetyltransferase